jgi:hypothetical protein
MNSHSLFRFSSSPKLRCMCTQICTRLFSQLFCHDFWSPDCFSFSLCGFKVIDGLPQILA